MTVNDLQHEINVVKQEINELKHEFKSIKSDNNNFKQDLIMLKIDKNLNKSDNVLTKSEENEALLIKLISQIENPELQQEYLNKLKKILRKLWKYLIKDRKSVV